MRNLLHCPFHYFRLTFKSSDIETAEKFRGQLKSGLKVGRSVDRTVVINLLISNSVKIRRSPNEYLAGIRIL